MKNIILWIGIVAYTVYYSLKFILSKDMNIPTLWGRKILHICNVHIETSGILPKPPFIIVANHESYFDIFSILSLANLRLIWFAKKELFKVPIFGRAIKAYGAIPVDRNDPKKASFSVIKALKRKKDDAVLVIFPQGTRKNLDNFKKGGFLLAKKLNMPILPMKIENSGKIMSADSFKINSGVIKVHFFKKIDPSDYSLDELSDIVKGKII